jgi:NAD(P)H-hydrate repair Nnr-like enzyme with NAD(P)H-hydrate epimerase domain
MGADQDNARGGAELERTRKLSLSELARLQLQALSKQAGEHATVELVRNAKGETQIRVVARTGDEGAETLAEAAELAQATYDALRMKYPLSEGAG